MSKREKFVLTSILLSLGFLGINFLDNQYRFLAIGALGGVSVLLFSWSLREALQLNATLTTLLLPFLFTIGVGLFWFLLPATIFARLPVAVLYGIGIYALALTLNIFTVSAIRTIALVRAARGVGFVLTLLTGFFLFDAILSLRADIWVVTILTSVVSFLLFLQSLWVSLLDRKLTKKLLLYTTVLTLGLLELSTLLYFWPVSVVVGSLFLAVTMYVLLGLGQAQLEERLFAKTAGEFLRIGVFVFLVIFVATSWGG